MSVAGLLVLKLLVNLTLWDAINAIPSIISVCVWSLGNTPGTWSCKPLQGHSWQYIRHPGKACGYMPAISCYLISGRALLGERKRNKPMLSPLSSPWDSP